MGIILSFSPQHGANTSSLWAIREKSGFLRKRNPEPTQLTTGPSNMFAPVPSRDGKKLFAIQGASRGELVRYDAKSQQFLPYLSGISAIQLAFFEGWAMGCLYELPGRNSVAQQSGRDGATSAHFFLQWRPMQPQWSPDGKQIAFAASMPGKPCIFISCR